MAPSRRRARSASGSPTCDGGPVRARLLLREHLAIETPPPREDVVPGSVWRVAHAFDTSLPGWLVVLPRRHVTAFSDLDGGDAESLGPPLVSRGSALRETVGCVETYVFQFAEAEGFAHLHVHVVPRAPDLVPELRGPRVFALLGRPEIERLPEAEQDRVALQIGAALERA